MKKILLFTLISFFAFANVAKAQYYYIPNVDAGTNPGGLNNDQEFPNGGGLAAGWTSIMGPNAATPAWSANQNIPFAFNFNDSLVTQFKVSSTGVLTFTVDATTVPNANNVAIPSTQIPNRSVCIWGITASGANDEILTKTFGNAPNRQHWIFFSSNALNTATGWTYWSIVLEETSNKIYIVDQRHAGTSGGVTAGIQIDESTAFSVVGSPALEPEAGQDPTSADNTYYEFNFGSLPFDYDIAIRELTTVPFGNLENVPFTIAGSFQSFGAETINSFDVNYSIDGGNAVTSSVTGVAIPSFDNYDFTSSMGWSPTTAGNYNLKVWIDNINGNADENNGNDTTELTVSVSNPIPNIIDQMLDGQRNDLLIASGNGMDDPKDLDFHPDLSRKELWVVNHRTEAQGGSTTKFTNVGEANQTSLTQVDGNAWHFMSLPTGIAFSENGNFANSPGVFDANHRIPAPTFGFTGPALWSSDPAIYAQPSGGNGSHFDMLHESPYCKGIAHEVGNVFWVHDGWTGDIVRYDFVDDHGPGADYHGDALVRRYPVPVGIFSTSRTTMVEVPSHLVLDKATDWLYIVDGNNRVLRLDITSGTNGGAPAYQQLEPLTEYTQMINIRWEVYIDSGKISQPAGIEVIGNRLLVGNYDDGVIHVYDLDASSSTKIGEIGTKEGVGLNGIKVGPEGNIWYVNGVNNQLRKLEPWATSVEESTFERNFNIYPNPSNGVFTLVNRNTDLEGFNVRITNVVGAEVMEEHSISRNEKTYDLSNLKNGVYFMVISNNSERFTKRIMISK